MINSNFSHSMLHFLNRLKESIPSSAVNSEEDGLSSELNSEEDGLNAELNSEEESLSFEEDELKPYVDNQTNNHRYKIPPIKIERSIFDKAMKAKYPERYQELGNMSSQESEEIQEGCSLPAKTANFRKITQFAKSILIDKKYLDVHWVDDFFSGNGEGKCSWLNTPSFVNKLVQNIPKEEEQSNPEPFVIDSLNLKYVTLEDSLPGTDERCSFIMLGRGIQGFVPIEEPGGRVILVITEDQMEEVLSYVKPCCDLLVIEGSGYITSRRLKTLEFAHHCQLNYLLMGDDNLSSFYISESLEIQNWGEMYGMMEQAMVENGCSFVAMNSYNPRVQAEFPDGDNIYLEKDVLRAKLYMINVKDCENIVGDRFDHLFPPEMEAWGEDLFFQLCLYFNDFEGGTISNDIAFLKRGRNKPNSCLDSLKRDEKIGNKKACFWNDAIPEVDAPEFHYEVYETLKQMVSHSEKEWKEKLHKLNHSDLGMKKKSDLTDYELDEIQKIV